MRRPPTIKDVAARAGVTVTTVSRCLNRRGYMSEATRVRIQQAMTDLDYVPNEIARSLLRRRSSIIGLIIPTANHPFFGQLTTSIEARAYEAGYKLMLCDSRLDSEKESQYIDMLIRHQVDGIIMASHTLRVDQYRRIGMPLVSMDRRIAERIPYVTSDNTAGGRLATRRLIEQGCRRLAFFTGKVNRALLPSRRVEAFEEEARAADLEPIVVQTGEDVFDFTQYQTLVDQLFREHPDVDGVIASDVKAGHVLQACRRFGRRVPQDVKVVGYDDILLASLLVPRLTTIHQPIEEMGSRAVDVLVAQIAGEAVAMKNVLPVSLV
ncbi:MAG TPA: LacI family DNA-binding transcriptional regulator, partial [Spirochaetia bacterium]|nr:LacI family DNA-binding transcriptional regulator [Spirochaetia bacterium]